MRIAELQPGILPGAHRPETVNLSRITAVVGTNGSGTSRILDALTLLTEGIVYDAGFRTRDPIKDRGIFLRLVPPTATEIAVSGRIAASNPKVDGEVLTWRMPIVREDETATTKTPKVRRPNGLPEEHILLLHHVETLLRKDPADARATLLPHIVRGLTPTEIRRAIDPMLPPMLPDASPMLGVPSTDPADPAEIPEGTAGDLLRCQVQIPQTIDELALFRTHLDGEVTRLSTLVTASGAIQVQTESTLPTEPLPGAAEHVQALLHGIDLIQSRRRSAADLADQADRLARGQESLDILAPDPGSAPTPPVLLPWDLVANVQEALRQGLAFPEQGPCCVVCGAPPSPVFAAVCTHVAELRAATAAETGPFLAAQATWVEASTRRTRALTLIEVAKGAVQDAESRLARVDIEIQAFPHREALGDLPGTLPVLGALWSVDDATLASATTTYRGQLDQIQRDGAAWRAYRAQTTGTSEVGPRLESTRRLLTRTEAAIRKLITAARDGFVSRMARYMPNGWEPVLHLEDARGRPLFLLTVRDTATGVEGFRPSGGQGLALLVAFTTALYEGDPPAYALYMPPEERMLSGETLGNLLRAWVRLPAWVQVVVTGGEPPKGKLPTDVDVIQLAPDGAILATRGRPGPADA